MKGTKWDGFLVLLFGFLSSVGIVSCIKLWLTGFPTNAAIWLFADGFFFALAGVIGYTVSLVRFVNYLRERGS